MTSLSDWLASPDASHFLKVRNGIWLKLTNQSTAVDYFSTVTDADGKWTINPAPPVGTYDVYVGTSSTGPWTATGYTYQVSGVVSTSGLALDSAVIHNTGSESIAGNKTATGDWYFKSGRPWADVVAFGADPTGSADSTTAIQAALDQVRTAGGGTVYLPPGLYTVHFVPHAVNSGFKVCMAVGANTHVRGAGRDATIVRLASGQSLGNESGTDVYQMVFNYQVNAPGGDEQITISDLTVDGNAGNQTHNHHGIRGIKVRGMRHERVRAMNCRGTDANGPPNESFHYEVHTSTDVSYTDCEVVGSAGTTASGFSVDYSSNIKYENCVAFGMSVGMGFTHYTCRNMQHTNCHSYLNGSAGFNSEISDAILYVNCLAGGRSANAVTYPYTTASTSLGNGQRGFVINGDTTTQLIGCAATYNGSGDGTGLTVELTPAGGNNKVVGGTFTHNLYGFKIFDTSATTLRIKNADFSGNTTAAGYVAPNTYTSVFGNVAAPAIPATGSAFTNPFPFDATVYIKPNATGTATTVSIGGTATGAVLPVGSTAAMFRLPVGQTITLAYGTSAPTWTWFLD